MKLLEFSNFPNIDEEKQHKFIPPSWLAEDMSPIGKWANVICLQKLHEQ